MTENSRAHLGPYPPRWKCGKEGLSYESHYRLSQQYPVILLLLLIVLAICCALIAVTFGTGRATTVIWNTGAAVLFSVLYTAVLACGNNHKLHGNGTEDEENILYIHNFVDPTDGEAL